MDKLSRAAFAGTVVFMMILGVAVAVKMDGQTATLALGALIGTVVAVPTTAIVVVIAMSGRRSDAQDTCDAPTTYCDPVRVVYVPRDADMPTRVAIAAHDLRIQPREAQRLIQSGDVKCLPAGR